MQPPSDGHDELSATERALVAVLRGTANAGDGFDARVMAAVRREPAHGKSLTLRRRGRLFGITAATAALAAALTLVVMRHEGSSAAGSARAAHIPVAPAAHTVRFTLVASGASHVSVAGSFNGWNTASTPLRRVGSNTWAADIPLGAGRYVYQFVIDGKRWVPDPRAPRDAGDDFGATNSVVTVAASGSA